jgi:hypothetical protein
MIGPSADWCPNGFTWCCILGGTTLFFLLVGRVMYKESFILFVIYIYSFLLNVTCLLCTCCTDPGIIPRKPILELKENIPPYYLQDIVDVRSKKLKTKKIMNPFKFCTTCKIYRPPRSSHCR